MIERMAREGEGFGGRLKIERKEEKEIVSRVLFPDGMLPYESIVRKIVHKC